VEHVLDNAETTIRPLQRRGIKVTLSILGNHQGAGFANFPTRKAADRFAQEVSATIRRYGLDGVDLDDEWVEYGANGTGQPNEFSFVAFVQSLRKRLPNRLITFYVIGPSAENQEHGGPRVGELLDYAWNPYYGQFRDFDVPGLPRSRYGAAAVDLGPESDTDPELVRDFAERTVEGGYGVYLTYQLQEGDQTELVSAFTEPLYGSPAHVGLPRAVPPAAEQPPPHAPTDPPRGPAPCAAELPGPAAPWDDRYSPVHVTRSRHEYEWLRLQLGVYTSGMASTPVVPTPPATAPGSGAARRPRAAVVGASGYAGGETLRLLAGHPDLDVATVTAHSSAGKRLSEVA